MEANYEENDAIRDDTPAEKKSPLLPGRVEVLIIGGGISGLAALHALRREGTDAFLVEGSGRVGGTMRTVDAPWGGKVELGPTTLRGKSEELNRLIGELELDDQVIETDPSARIRFILRKGRPVEVPSTPKGGIETGLISIPGKVRLLGERFVRRGSGGAESVAQFFRRRFGAEVLNYGVDPFVAGIYAGDPERLSLNHTFPILQQMEAEYGSLIRGGLARMKAKRGETESTPSRRPFSFREGLSRLPEAIAERHRRALALGTPVMGLEKGGEKWSVTTRRGKILADRVILATGAEMASDLLRAIDEPGADLLDSIESSPVAILPLLYDADAFPQRPEGFGLLVPGVEGRSILGVIYASSIFPERVPEGKVLLTVFIGGARRPELTERSGSELRSIAAGEIAEILGATADPIDSLYQLWRPGIPQYTLGYERILDGIDLIEQRHPGLTLLGSYRGGVSVPDCVEAGLRVVGAQS